MTDEGYVKRRRLQPVTAPLCCFVRQIASNEHLALTSKNREAMEEVMRLRGVLQLREKSFAERGAEIEQKKEREKHLWTELSTLQKDAAAAKSELAVLSNSLEAAKAEIESGTCACSRVRPCSELMSTHSCACQAAACRCFLLLATNPQI